MRKFLLALAFLLIAIPARAETLDDAGVRAVYAEAAAAIRDKDKTHAIMEARLDNNYVMKTNETRAIGKIPAQQAAETLNKTQAIRNAMKGYDLMNIDKYHYDIASIKFSDDNKIATVTDTVTSSGTVIMSPDGQHRLTAHYVVGAACRDTLSLVDGTIKYMHTDCDTKMSLTL